MRGVSEIHHRNAALIPSLHFDITSGNWYQGSVMRDAVFCFRLSGGHLVVACQRKFVVFQVEYRIRSPLVGVRRTAARLQPSTPLVGEDHLGSVIGERSRVPVGIVRVIHGVHTLWMDWIFYI